MEKIDKKAVIKIIEDMDTRQGILYQINALPTSDGWVSVAERLPETDGVYLVWGSTYSDTPRKVLRCNYYKKIFKSDNGMGVKTKNITHWQPLPTPPTK